MQYLIGNNFPTKDSPAIFCSPLNNGDHTIFLGKARPDMVRMEIEIQTLDRGEVIISTICILFPVSTQIHRYEDYFAGLNTEKMMDIRGPCFLPDSHKPFLYHGW